MLIIHIIHCFFSLFKLFQMYFLFPFKTSLHYNILNISNKALFERNTQNFFFKRVNLEYFHIYLHIFVFLRHLKQHRLKSMSSSMINEELVSVQPGRIIGCTILHKIKKNIVL